MSQPDDRTPEEPNGSSDVEPALDEDAVWAEIVANYGDRPVMGADPSVVEDGPPEVEERAQRASRNHRQKRPTSEESPCTPARPSRSPGT